MANKKKGYNTGRKVIILRDVLKITNSKSGGFYALMPFENIDEKGRAVFKIGMSATSMEKRMDTYHTYFPEAVYYEAFLIDPPVRGQQTRAMTKLKKRKEYYLEIEKFIIDYILKQPKTKRIHSTSRIRNLNENLEGETEWIYCKENDIHKAFEEAKKKFGGKLYKYNLVGVDDETGEKFSINDTANLKAKNNPIYTGEVIFRS